MTDIIATSSQPEISQSIIDAAHQPVEVPVSFIEKPHGSYGQENRELLEGVSTESILDRMHDDTVIRNLGKLSTTLMEKNQQKDVENDELREKLRFDTLTGVGSFDALNDDINLLLQTNPEHIEVIFFDIDNFKNVNDSFGHETGDMALYALAQAFFGELRDGESIYRKSGDEFIIVRDLSVSKDRRTNSSGDTNDDERRTGKDRRISDSEDELVGRIEKGFESATLLLNGMLKDKEVPDIILDGSYGVAKYQAGDDAARLIDRADEAMYQQKQDKKRSLVKSLSPSFIVWF